MATRPNKRKGQLRRTTVNAMLKEAILISAHRAGQEIRFAQTEDDEDGPDLNGNILDFFTWAAKHETPAFLGLLKVIFQHDVELASKVVAPHNVEVYLEDEDA